MRGGGDGFMGGFHGGGLHGGGFGRWGHMHEHDAALHPLPEEEPEDTPLVEELPERVRAQALRSGEEPCVAVKTDMLPSGSFGEGWFLCTDDRLVAYHPGNDGDALRELQLSAIRKIDVRSMPGCFRLSAHTDAGAHVLVGYSGARRRAMDRALEVVRGKIPGMAAPEEDSRRSGRRPRRDSVPGVCDTCGGKLDPRTGACPQCKNKGRTVWRLVSRTRAYWLYIAAGLLLLLLLTGASTANPALLKMLIDDAFPNKDLELFRRLLAAIAALLILAPVFSGVRTYVMSWLGQKVVHDLRTELYRKIHALSLDFYDRRQTGWIMDRVNADTENLRQFITEGLQENVRDATQLVFIIIIMFWMNWPLALLGLVPAPIVTYLVIRFFRRLGPLFHASWRARAALASTLTNVIPGVRVVKAFVQEAREKLRFDGLSRRFMNASVRVGRKRALFEPSTALVNALGAIVIWGVGGYLYITATPFRGKVVEIGTLVAFMMYLGQFNGAIRNLGRMVEQLQRAMTAAQRIFEVLDTRPSIRNPADGAVLPIAQGVIEFDNVSFEYVPGKRVLKNVSFSVRPGEMVGFVGPSGAGKSTSINLLCRFYDVVEGAIRVDGLDIRDVTVESLRAQMGVVLQEPFLFHGSVADNIAYGDPEATSARVVAAAKAANAHEFILQMPDGYDTLVGERGQRLSGGERQRISIARAILKDPRILILDEATSSVDTETEALIREAVERLVQGRTTIAIAHRLSTLRNADRLVVLDQGRLVEIGSHEELMAKEGGLFRRLTDMQTAMNEIVAVGG